MLSLARVREIRNQVAVQTSSTGPSQRVTITAPDSQCPNATTLYIRDRCQAPGMALINLEHNPVGFTHLDPNYTYVARRGRGRSRRNYFVRGTPGRTTPYNPPPWRVPEDNPPIYVYRHDHPWPGSGGGGCGNGGAGYGGCMFPRPPPPPPPPQVRCQCPPLGCDRGRRPRRPTHTRCHHPGTVTPTLHNGVIVREPKPPPQKRHVHWPDACSDGSLSPVPSLCSSSSSSSSSSSESESDYGGCRLPRTPSSSPQRGPRKCHPPPRAMCGRGCGGCCDVESLGYGGYPRDMTERGGARWREAPCWDDRLGSGLVREPGW